VPITRVGFEVSSAPASGGTAAAPFGLPNFATGGGGGGGAADDGGAALLLLGGGVTTDTVCDGDAVGKDGPGTGEPWIVVPQPATKAASNTTTCLPDMAGTLNPLPQRAKHLAKRPRDQGVLQVFHDRDRPNRDKIRLFTLPQPVSAGAGR
jgi:hypothetical protein